MSVNQDSGRPEVAAGTHDHIHPGLALLVIAGAQLMIVLDATIVNIALPSIQRALHFSPTSLAWVLNAYTLAFGGLLLLGGRSGDLFGRRRMFIIGILIFAGASLAGGFATTEAWLLICRVLQGVGGAIASPTALALVTNTFPEGPARNRAFGVYAAVSGAGAAIGLILGGVLTEYLSWRWVLFVNVPIGLALAVATPYVLPESKRTPGHLDLPGAVTSTLGVSSLVYGLIHAALEGWRDPVTLVSLGLSAVLIVAFLVIESRSEQPLMPLRLFSDRNRDASYVVMLSTGAALFSMFFFLTQFVQVILGYSPIQAGFAFLPVSVVIVISAQIASRMVAKTGARPLVIFGSVLAGLALLWLSTIDASSGYLTLLLPCMVVMAFGLGFLFVPITLTAVSGVEPRDSGIASAMLNVTQQLGGTIGLAALVTVFTTAVTNFVANAVASGGAATGPPTAEQAQQLQLNALAHGWATGFRAAVFFAAIALIAAIVGVKSTPMDPQAEGAVETVPAP
jgi:EmrB/QacA subfamily drug resistance transporter